MKPLRYHPSVQRDIDQALGFYFEASEEVAGNFWKELSNALKRIQRNPERCHYDESGLRRFNLKKYPFHILFVEFPDRVRIQVVRHDSRKPSYGTRRRRI